MIGEFPCGHVGCRTNTWTIGHGPQHVTVVHAADCPRRRAAAGEFGHGMWRPEAPVLGFASGSRPREFETETAAPPTSLWLVALAIVAVLAWLSVLFVWRFG